MKKNPLVPPPTALFEKTPADNLDAIAARAYQSWEKGTTPQEHASEPPAARELLRESAIQADTNSRQARGAEAPAPPAAPIDRKP